MDVAQIKDILGKMIAILHGGRDRNGSPVIVFPALDSGAVDYSLNEVLLVLSYLARIPDDVDIQHGFCVVVDMRNVCIRHLRMVLRAIQQVLATKLKHVVIVKPANFLEKQRIGLELRLEAYDFKVVLVSIEKLGRYVDSPYLPRFLGGTFHYVHGKWLDLRLRYEGFLREGAAMLKELEQLHALDSEVVASRNSSDELMQQRRFSMNLQAPCTTLSSDDRAQRVTSCLIKGDLLLSDLKAEELSDSSPFLKVQNPDMRAAVRRTEILLSEISNCKKRLHDTTAQKTRGHGEHVLHDQFCMGVKNLTEWFLGAGEKWLSSLNEISESRDEAEQLQTEYEQLLTKSQEVLEQVSDLRAIADQLLEMGHGNVAEISKKREYLEAVSKSFGKRVKRQCELVLLCSTFYGLVDKFGNSLDEMLEELCSEIAADDVNSTEIAIQQLDIRIESIDKAFSDIMTQGHALVDQLTCDAAPERTGGASNASNYADGASQVRRVLENVDVRKERCNELSDVRRLKLQQLYQLYTCEKDAEQATRWLDELIESVALQPLRIDITADDVARLKKDLFKLENTAKSTYDYGKQLAQASLVLRRSLRFELQPNAELLRNLEDTWRQFVRALSERSARLTVTASFVSTLQQANARLEELCGIANEEMSQESASAWSSGSSTSRRSSQAEGRRCELLRRQAASDVRDLKSLADTLVKKINRPFCSRPAASTECSEQDNSTILEIRSRLAEVEERQHLLDTYWTEPVSALVRDMCLSSDHPYLHANPTSSVQPAGQ